MDAAEKHPAQIAAEDRARKAKYELSQRRALLDVATMTLGLHFTHVRASVIVPVDIGNGRFVGEPVTLQYGGMTVAWRRTERDGRREGDIIEAAIGICNPTDSFSKFEGRYHAAAGFNTGKKVRLPIPRGKSVSEALQAAFGALLAA